MENAEASASPRSRQVKEKEDKRLITNIMSGEQKKRRRWCICAWVTAVIVGLGLLFLILGLTVFKAKRPAINVNSVALADLDFSLDVARLRVLLNVTLDVDLTVENPNRVGFRYSNSTAFLRYKGNDFGEVPIPAGRIGARDTRALNLTVTVMADRLLTDSGIYSDALTGTLPFQTYIRMPGKVRILFNINVVAYATCDFQINLVNRTLSDQKCYYRTKL